MPQHHDTAGALLFGECNRGVDPGEDALGICLGLFFGGFGDGLVGHIGLASGHLFDRGCGGRVFTAGFGGLGSRRCFHGSWRNGVALQVRQGDTQTAPLGIR
ncbi:hypothetical protein D9M73_162380 [compost metagenome]